MTIIFKWMRLWINIILYYLTFLIPKNKKRVIFGSWNGKKYGDNAKYFFEYLQKNSDLELVWCGNKELEKLIPKTDNSKFVERNSLISYYYAFTAKYVFVTHSFIDISIFYCFGNSVITQMWHGGGIKRILADAREWEHEKGEISKLKWYSYKWGIKTYNNCSHFIASGKMREEKMMSSFKFFNINSDKIIRHGQPRNDYLFFNKHNVKELKHLKSILEKNYGIPSNKKIILYMPTFRESKLKENFLFSKMESVYKNILISILDKHNAVLVEKNHPAVVTNIETHNDINCGIYNISSLKNIDTQELLLCSDMLITDYSGCYLDYLILNRPIIHYAYDYDSYVNNDRGFAYNYIDVVAGPVVDNLDLLFEEIDNNLEDDDLYLEKRKTLSSTMINFEKGLSSVNVFKAVFETDKQ